MTAKFHHVQYFGEKSFWGKVIWGKVFLGKDVVPVISMFIYLSSNALNIIYIKSNLFNVRFKRND
jgi:hypothetical protein